MNGQRVNVSFEHDVSINNPDREPMFELGNCSPVSLTGCELVRVPRARRWVHNNGNQHGESHYARNGV